MIGRFNNLQDVLNNGEVIEPNIYSEIDSLNQGVLYVKRDYLFRSGDWRGVHIDAGVTTAKTKHIDTIVVSHSDFITNRIDVIRTKVTSGVSKIFGTNTIPFRNFAFSLPLGLTSDEESSEVHHLFSNHSLLSIAHGQIESTKTFEGTIYANFNYATNVKKRLPLLKMLPDLPYKIINQEPEISKEGRINYLRNLRNASLVLCPEGNGVDTHRIWETLYMGGTPVVLRNPVMSSLLDLLPVIQLKSWKELQNITQIEKRWTNIETLKWDSQMLYKNYWHKKINGLN